jgi:hypothetical protein
MLLSRTRPANTSARRTRALGRVGSLVEVSSVSADASSNTCVAATEPESESHANDEETDACAASEETRRATRALGRMTEDEDSAAELRRQTFPATEPKRNAFGDAPAPAFDVIRRLEASRVRPPEGHAL